MTGQGQRLTLVTLMCVGAALGGLWGCSDSSKSETANIDEEGQTPDGQEAALTFHRDIKPLLNAHCNGCHSEGGVGPFQLTTYEQVQPLAQAALTSIQERTMPPWPADPDCHTFLDERFMPEEAIAKFEAWVNDGAPEGDPADAATTEQPQEVSFEATHTAFVAEPYTPSPENPDDYRCFILDVDFPTDSFMTASNILPDAGALVHHVLVYAIEPDQLAEIQAADAETPQEGYTCFGTPFPSNGESDNLSSLASGGGLPTQLGAWVPGNAPNVLTDGYAIPIKAGSKIVMQVHYNMLGGDPVPDATAFQMRLTTEPPEMVVKTKPLIIYGLDIPAGEPEAINTQTFRNYTRKTFTIASVSAHMHLLGSRYNVSIERNDTDTTECLLDIPKWDFGWQMNYKLPLDAMIEVPPGDAISLTCVYDNSAANQPTVNGEQIEPRDVTWGEGTLDEMCMVYLTLIEPYEPPAPDTGAGACGATNECLAACAEAGTSTSECLMGCETSPGSCNVCALQQAIPCSSSCLSSFVALQSADCLETCMIGGVMLGNNIDACFKDRCPEEYGRLTTCLDPVLDSGQCNDAMANECGIELHSP